MPLAKRQEPIPHRCTLGEAYLWIAKDIPPGHLDIGRGALERLESRAAVLALHPDVRDSLAFAQLLNALRDGLLSAQGYPMVEPPDGFEGAKWGDNAVDIPLTALEACSIHDLRSGNVVIGGGRNGHAPYLAVSTHQYDGVTVGTGDLFGNFPSITGWEMALLRSFPRPEAARIEDGRGYTTTLLDALDAIRAKMAADEEPMRWTRDSIEAECRNLLPPGWSGRDVSAIATVLLPDTKRWKGKK